MPLNHASPSRDTAVSSRGWWQEGGVACDSSEVDHARPSRPEQRSPSGQNPVQLLRTEWQSLTVLRAVVNSRNYFQQIRCHQSHLSLSGDFPGPRTRSPTQHLWKLRFRHLHSCLMEVAMSLGAKWGQAEDKLEWKRRLGETRLSGTRAESL